MPIAIDLYCGLGGWTEGLLATGWTVYGFDITRHVYGDSRYPAQLILQDALTIHGSQFRNADLIVASPPCQSYSWLAMPWSRSADPNNSRKAKELRRKWETEGPDNRLFDTCFRIQREACEAAGRYIPMVVENVRGARPWVGKAKANFGSFYLWGDVAMVGRRVVAMRDGRPVDGGIAPSREATKAPGQDWNRFRLNGEVSPDWKIQGTAVKTTGHVNKRDGHSHSRHLTNQAESDAVKIGGDWFSDPNSTCRKHGSKSNARKAASALIAKIPLPLSQYVARSFYP